MKEKEKEETCQLESFRFDFGWEQRHKPNLVIQSKEDILKDCKKLNNSNYHKQIQKLRPLLDVSNGNTKSAVDIILKNRCIPPPEQEWDEEKVLPIGIKNLNKSGKFLEGMRGANTSRYANHSRYQSEFMASSNVSQYESNLDKENQSQIGNAVKKVDHFLVKQNYPPKEDSKKPTIVKVKLAARVLVDKKEKSSQFFKRL
jgi:hypothetical protein